MTIEELYNRCDSINLYTDVFILDTDQNPVLWNKCFLDVQGSLLQSEIGHFKIIDNEVLIWVL